MNADNGIRKLAEIRNVSPLAPTLSGRAFNEALTIARGLAAWAVVLTHCILTTQSVQGAAMPWWIATLDMGGLAVMVFFCLSGFTLFLAHSNDQWNRAGLVSFMVRRVFRIYPAFLVSALVCLVILLWLQSSDALSGSSWLLDSDRIPTLAEMMAYLTLSSNLFGVGGHLNTVYWSLPVEFQFYIMFPFFVIILRKSPAGLLALTMLVALGAFVLHIPGHTLMMAWIFAVGMITSSFYVGHRYRLNGTTALVIVLASLGIGLFVANLPGDHLTRLHLPKDLFLGVLAPFLVFGAAQLDITRSLPDVLSRILRVQGEISYSVYLFHMPFALLAYGVIHSFGLEGSVATLCIYGIVLPGTWFVAHLSFKYIEKPGVKVGRVITRTSR